MNSPTDLLRAMPVFAAMPTAASAMADVALTAAQRAVVLQIELIDGLVGLAIARSRRAAADPAGTLRDALLGPATVEPAWRYATGLVAIGQGAAASMVSLATAQARGATGELDGLSRDAKDAAARSAADVTSVATAAMTHGLAAVRQLAGSAAQAALHSATEAPMRAAADIAASAGDAAVRGTGATLGAADAAARVALDLPRRVAGSAETGADAVLEAGRAGPHEGRANGRADGPSPRARAASKASRAARSSAPRGSAGKKAASGRGTPSARGAGAKARGTKHRTASGRG